MDTLIHHLSVLYAPLSSPTDRAISHGVLETIAASPSALETATEILVTLSTTTNNPPPEQAIFFALQIIGECARKSTWQFIPSTSRQTIRNAVLAAVTRNTSRPTIANKAAETLILLARRDWPEYWPSFLNDVVDLARQHNSYACLQALTDGSFTTWTQRDEIPQSRRKDIIALLAANEGVLCDTLDALLTTQSPSPSLLQVLVPFLERVSLTHASLFSIIQKLFDISLSTRNPISTTALAQVTERNYLPTAQDQNFVFLVAGHVLALLTPSPQNTSAYEAALVEFVAAFIKNDLTRAERDLSRFNVAGFLERFFMFTFELRDLDAFVRSLDVWNAFVDHVATSNAQNEMQSVTTPASPTAQLYVPVLGELTFRLLSRFMYSHQRDNPQLLHSLEQQFDLATRGDDDDDDDNTPVTTTCDDLTYIVDKIVSVIGLTATLPLPVEIVAQGVSKVVEQTLAGIRVLVPKLSAPLSMQEARDMITHLKVVAATAPLFALMTNMHAIAKELVLACVITGETCLTYRMHRLGAIYAQMLQQALDSLSSFQGWFVLVIKLQEFDLMCRVADLALGVLCSGKRAATTTEQQQASDTPLPDRPKMAATHLLQSIPAQILVSRNVAISAFQTGLYRTFADANLSSEILDALYVVFCKAAFQTNNITTQTCWQLFGGDVEMFSNDVVRLLQMENPAGMFTVIRARLRALKSVAQCAQAIPETQVRQCLHAVLKDTIGGGSGGTFTLLDIAARCMTSSPNPSSYLARDTLEYLRLLLMQFGRQLGQQDTLLIANVVVQTFGVRQQFVAQLFDLLTDKAVMLLGRVLGVLEALVSNRALVLDVQLPGMLDLVFSKNGGIWDEAEKRHFDGTVADCTKFALLVLESRWTDWFTEKPGGERVFRDTQREQWFLLVMDRVVSRLALQSNIDDLRFVVVGLGDLNKNLGLFYFDPFVTRYKTDVVRRIVQLVASQEREMVLEELTDLVWELVTRDLQWFFSQVREDYQSLFVSGGRVDKNSFKEGLIRWVEVGGNG